MKNIVKVEGMMCIGCSNSVKDILLNIEGVKSVHVDLEKGIAEIESDKDISIEKLQDIMDENDSNYAISPI